MLSLAERYSISSAVAGATLSAAVTSAPELGTNLFSVIADRQELAATGSTTGTANLGIGTVLGSAVFNVTVIGGVIGWIGAPRLDRAVFYRDGLAYALAVGLLLIVATGFGAAPSISTVEALILLGAYAGYVLWMRRDSGAKPEKLERRMGTRSAWLVLLACVVIVGVACHFLVESSRFLATATARAFGLDDAAMKIYLSAVVIAAATSVPDALTSIAAARRGEGAMAISNALGSNTFDILVCLGLPYALFGGQSLDTRLAPIGIFLFGCVGLVLLLIRRGWSLHRREGTVLLLTYLLFVVFLTALQV